MLFLLLLGTLISCARADCDACVDGHCFSRKTLIQGFHVSDRFAIDHTNNVLYVQLNSSLNTAFDLDDLQIHLIQSANTTGMAFDQKEKVLYTSEPNTKMYKYKRDSNTTEIITDSSENVDLIFYQDTLYYTIKDAKGLCLIEDEVEKHYTYLVNYTITDLVVTKNYIYFVADGNVYIYEKSWLQHPEIISKKKFSLSIDKNYNVYFGDEAANVIYKVNELREFKEYAAYNTGAVGRFVFDKDNNIVFYDKLTGDVVTWKSQHKKCRIHTKYSIVEISDD